MVAAASEWATHADTSQQVRLVYGLFAKGAHVMVVVVDTTTLTPTIVQ